MNPPNHFHDFFQKHGNSEAIEHFLPPPSFLIEALVRVCAKHPFWWQNASLRLKVAGGMAGAAKSLKQRIEKGKDPGIHPAEAAFMMMVSDRMTQSYEDYASDEEREVFPYDPSMDPRSEDDFSDVEKFDRED